SLKHRSGQRLAASRSCDSVCRKHFRHPRIGRRAGVLAAWLHWRSREYACGLSVCVRNNFCLRPGLAHWREISSSRHSCSRKRRHHLNGRQLLERSEERRVGKECGCGRWTESGREKIRGGVRTTESE